MRKNWKKIIVFLLMITLLYPTLAVHAHPAMKIERKTYITTGERSEAKYYTNKGYAYCITPDRIGAGEGTTLNYMSNETKGGLLYILDKSGTSDQDYLKSQLAIWILRNNYMPGYYVNNSNLDIVVKAKALAAEAAKQANYSSTQPSIKINPVSSNLSLTADGQYYESSTITIQTTGLKSTPKIELINAPQDTQIKDINTNNSTITKQILVPANKITQATSFKIKVTGISNIKTVEKYSTGTAQWQDLAVLASESKTITQTVDFSITPIVRKCEFYNNQYYDQNGFITTQENYEIECKTHTCEKIGEKYFGLNGKEVTQETYNIECITHVCEKVGNKYFGKDGKEVLETDYKAQCIPQQVIVPDTNSTSISNIISIIIGSIFLGTTIGIVTFYSDKKKQLIEK